MKSSRSSLCRKRGLFSLGALAAGVLLYGVSVSGCTTNIPMGDPCPGGICAIPDGGSPSPDGGPCVENWVCTPWTTTGSGSNQGTRTCQDMNSCGSVLLKPALAAALPPLDLNYYKCNVEPILDKKCSQLTCHGTESARALRTYARARHRNAESIPVTSGNTCFPGMTTIALDQACEGSLQCECGTGPHTATEWQRNYDSARSFALDAQLMRIAAGQEDTSDLLAQPVIGGKSHNSIHLFQKTDADYVTIKTWLGGATLATCNPLPN